jgi:large subunit ribosomal protein L35
MPKMKTRRGAAKRFKITKSGRIKRRRAYRAHILEHKPPKRRRQARKAQSVGSADAKSVRRMLPYA